MDWQSIETAPRDGTEFIAAIWWTDFEEWEVVPMKWHDHARRFGRDYAPFVEDDEQPAKWQPMPAPPAEKG